MLIFDVDLPPLDLGDIGPGTPDDSTLIGELPDFAKPLTVNAFARMISDIAAQQGPGQIQPVVSADPQKEFHIPAPQPAAPPSVPPAPESTGQLTREQELLRENGGNPVINR